MKRKLQNIAYLLMAAALITSCGEKKQTAEFPDWAWADFQRPEGINPITSNECPYLYFIRQTTVRKNWKIPAVAKTHVLL